MRATAVAFVALSAFSLGGTLLAGGQEHEGIKLPWYWLQTFPVTAAVIPDRFSIIADGAAAAMLAFGLDGDLLLAPNVQFALREGSLVNLAPFRRGRDGIENTAFGDADFNMLGHQSIAVAGDTDAGIFRPGMARVECWDALFFGKG